MPFDPERLDAVREALGGLWTDYRSAAAAAADEVEGMLRAARTAAEDDRGPAFAATLGYLGAAHIDVESLAPLFDAEAALPPPALNAMEAAAAVLREIACEPDPTPVDLPPGGSLTDAVGHALARVGRAFGAAHVVALARAGRFDRNEHGPWLKAYPFSRWSRRERRLAPPLLVTLEGADLRAGGLTEFLDGAIKLVLIVRDDAAPPAPLVRLVSPGVYLAQTHDGAALARLGGWSGPGVVAWVPEGSAAFVHDPAAGPALGARIQVISEPPPPRRGLGGLSAAQLADELRQLEALAGTATLGEQPAPSGTDKENPVDRLAAWILSQASADDAAAQAEP
ncbi:MAG: hypothetical protein Q8R92_10845 [Deltaproteobacteria bacterium]|nr:hypothetical protein [Deltaproteobacteria bacterium]